MLIIFGRIMSSSYRLELDRWLAQLDVKADRVLDIGGAQLPIKGRTKTWDVNEYLIADLPEPHVGSPKPNIELDLNSSRIIVQANTRCDLVFCLEVFDYVWSPLDAMRHLSLYLKDGGTAWVTFPMQYPLHQPVDDDSLRYMPGGIKKLAAAAGLTIKQMIPRKTETDAIYQAFRTERMRCAKHEDHNISGWIVEFTK